MESAENYTGLVIKFNPSKGCGIIREDKTDNQILVHKLDGIPMNPILSEGDRVSFNCKVGSIGRMAYNVIRLKHKNYEG